VVKNGNKRVDPATVLTETDKKEILQSWERGMDFLNSVGKCPDFSAENVKFMEIIGFNITKWNACPLRSLPSGMTSYEFSQFEFQKPNKGTAI
jgi:hypothetical protein